MQNLSYDECDFLMELLRDWYLKQSPEWNQDLSEDAEVRWQSRHNSGSELSESQIQSLWENLQNQKFQQVHSSI